MNKITQNKINRFISNPFHALIITSPDDVYNEKIAAHISKQLVGVKADEYAYYRKWEGANGTISVEQIRQLSEFLKLKVPTNLKINRIAVISQAQTMSLEAQNALLKNLEEPVQNALIILCINNLNSLLPTLISRSQRIIVSLPDLAETKSYYSQFNDKDIAKAFNQAAGLPELTLAILENKDHPVYETTKLAKLFLSATKFERLSITNGLKDRQTCIQLSDMLMQISRIGIKSHDSTRWVGVYRCAYNAKLLLEANSQPKLVMTNLSLSI